jgi:diguanylate cyclase (GGDEF)-like protein
MSLRRLTLRAKLLSLAGIGALFTSLLAAVALVGHAQLAQVNAEQVRLSDVQTQVLEASRYQRQLRAQVWFAYLVSGGGVDEEREHVTEEFDDAAAGLRQASERLHLLADGAKDPDALHQLASEEREFADTAAEQAEVAFTNRAAGVKTLADFETIADGLDQKVMKLSAEVGAQRAAGVRAAENARETQSVSLLLLGLAAVAVLLGLSIALTRSTLRALQRVGTVANRISEGDLQARCEIERDDEIGVLAAAFNNMANTLQGTMSQLAAEAKRDGFGTQLAEAFEMVDSETDTYQVIEQAMQILGPTNPAELLLADSSKAQLAGRASHPTAGAPCCPVKSPFSCIAVRRGNLVTFDDSEQLNACPKLKNRPEGALSAVCVPVTFMGRALGVLHTTGPVGAQVDPERLTALGTLAGQAGARIGTLRSFERAQLQATTDDLTGMLNRRAFETEARHIVQERQLFSLVMADLDHFKRLNDTHGHETGDRALRIFAQAVRDTLRAGDVAGRVGGEEFALVLRGIPAPEGTAVIERLQRALKDATAGGAPTFTASYGITDTEFIEGSLDDLLRVADAALYRAKQEGRDRIVAADERDLRSAQAATPLLRPAPDAEPPMHRHARSDDPMDRVTPLR